MIECVQKNINKNEWRTVTTLEYKGGRRRTSGAWRLYQGGLRTDTTRADFDSSRRCHAWGLGFEFPWLTPDMETSYTGSPSDTDDAGK